jgi:hypothetical protein
LLFSDATSKINRAGKDKEIVFMKSTAQLKSATQMLIVILILLCLGLLPKVHAVVPPPDGGYPGANTAEGQNALLSLTTGGFNTAVGWLSLRTNTVGNFNTAVGAAALFRNIGDENTATGAGALISNSTGVNNTATGAFALFSNTGGPTTPNQPSGGPGSSNTANGERALFSNTTGSGNTAVGKSALANNTIGDGNTATGVGALSTNTEGLFNTAVGNAALGANTTGDGNIALGAFAGVGVNGATSVIAIGAAGQDVSNSCFIGQIYTNIQPQVGTDPDTVTINSNGRLGRANVSSRRYKHDVKPMENASEAIYALKPVSFRYHKQYDATQTIAFGLIAEEVAEVNPDLVGRNPEGQPESVRYEQINAMLLNEFLKEHRKNEEQNSKIESQARQIQEQETIIAELKSEMKVLAATVNEQAAQLQVVNAQLQIDNAAEAIVRNH